LSSGQHIQMLTALVLQLVQCTVTTPTIKKEERDLSSEKSKDGDKPEGDKAHSGKKVKMEDLTSEIYKPNYNTVD